MPKKALLIIDMLNDFVQEGGALYTGEAGHRVIPVISKVLKRARAEKMACYLPLRPTYKC
ncbi:MAG: hypothetical protein RQM95_06820 [Syntrophaceticus schinkii]